MKRKMHEINFDEAIDRILARDSRYHPDAYQFLREALDFTQKKIRTENRGRVRHVTGQELLEGVRQFALEHFGPMSMTVLNEWGIRSCRQFGDIVFNMVEIGLLAKTATDTRGDFENGYDFDDAFRRPFLPPSKLPRGVPVTERS